MLKPMATFQEYDTYDAFGLAAVIARGEASAAEVLEAAIERSERVNPKINAIICPLFERAREQAAQPLNSGPFAGVPFLMKDLGQAVAGEYLRNGSRFFRDYKPDYDAEIVRRFHQSGCITFGKTSAPELGLVGTTEPLLFGPTRNPWDPERVAGGSSGGAGAAVAAGIVPMASASDGGGSIRIPAACCGLVGLKPSRGRNPSGPGLGEGWYGQVQDGVITKTIRDTAIMLDATAGGDIGMPYTAPPPKLSYQDEIARPVERLRIAVCRDSLCCEHPLSDECIEALDKTAEQLTALGHIVEDAVPGFDRIALGSAFLMRVIACTGAEIADAQNLLGRNARGDDFEPMTRAFANLARSYSAVDLTVANRQIEREMRKLGRFMEAYDVMLTPTTATPPAALGVFEPQGIDAILTRILARVSLGPVVKWTNTLEQLVESNFDFVVSTMVANMSGEPSISLPLQQTKTGLPIGMMFTAKIYDEAVLLRLAAQLEQAHPWASRQPPIHASRPY